MARTLVLAGGMWDYPGVIDGAAVLFNWVLLGLLAAGLGLSLTVARRTRLGRRGVRWGLVICAVVEVIQLINLYVQRQWAAELFFLVGPVALGSVIAEVQWRKAHSARRTAKL
jgi:hypothetical protein